MNETSSVLSKLLTQQQDAITDEWLAEGAAPGTEASVRADAGALLVALQAGLRSGASLDDLQAPGWGAVCEVLDGLAKTQAARGYSAAETSRLVLALKRPLFLRLQQAAGSDGARLGRDTWAVSSLVDAMAQMTIGTYQRAREEVIQRQQQELLELSTPVVKLWDGVLAVPMIGTLDSSRTQLVMEALLQRIVDTGSELAIIDITGVLTVDTLVAQHLLKTVTAIRLMGADCIISGIRPQIAQTIVHLGIDLQGVTTKASLADALSLAMKRVGYTVSRDKR